MNHLSIQTTLETHFKTFWTTTAICFENTTLKPAAGSYYVKPKVIFSSTDQVDSGQNGVLNAVGIFVIEIFGPLQAGTGQLMIYADSIRDYFSGKSFSNLVHTKTGKIGPKLEDDGKYKIPVIIPFNSYQDPS